MKLRRQLAFVFTPGINVMRHALRASGLVPNGLIVERVSDDFSGPVITVRAASKTSPCPGCGAASGRVHSRYRRRLTDLPVASKLVHLVILARRFHCDAVLCGRRIFAERFDEKVLAHGREEPRALIPSSTASASRWAAGPRPVSRAASCCQ